MDDNLIEVGNEKIVEIARQYNKEGVL